MGFVKIAVVVCLLTIFYQDLKDRLVHWWLFAIGTVGLAILHIQNVGYTFFGFNIMVNCAIVCLVLSILWAYARFKMNVSNLRDIFGLGDILFLFLIAIGFSTISFLTFFVFGLLFSLLVHIILRYSLSRKRDLEPKEMTVPLAGYLALFFSAILLVHWSGFYDDLYTI